MSEEKDERLEEILAGCKSVEEKAIMELLPVFERDFAVVYDKMSKLGLEFSIRDCKGSTAQVRAKKGKVYIVEGRFDRGHCADYRIMIKKGRKGMPFINVVEADGICEDVPTTLYERSLKKFLRMCVNEYQERPQRVEERLKRISSLPAACLQYLEDLKDEKKSKSMLPPFVDEIKKKSAALMESAGISHYYYNDQETFRAVFERLDDDSKKKVLQDLFVKREGREELDRWLEERYSGLIDESWREKNYEK